MYQLYSITPSQRGNDPPILKMLAEGPHRSTMARLMNYRQHNKERGDAAKFAIYRGNSLVSSTY